LPSPAFRKEGASTTVEGRAGTAHPLRGIAALLEQVSIRTGL
jgi:hypothetical protein